MFSWSFACVWYEPQYLCIKARPFWRSTWFDFKAGIAFRQIVRSSQTFGSIDLKRSSTRPRSSEAFYQRVSNRVPRELWDGIEITVDGKPKKVEMLDSQFHTANRADRLIDCSKLGQNRYLMTATWTHKGVEIAPRITRCSISCFRFRSRAGSWAYKHGATTGARNQP